MGNEALGYIRKSKVVFACNELGAFRRHREYLASTLAECGSEVILYADNSEGLSEQLKYEYRRINIERFRFDILSDAHLFWCLFLVLRRENPDVLHLINLKPYLYGGLAAFCSRLFGWRGKLVITVAGLGRLYDPDPQRPVRKGIQRFLVESALRVSTKLASVTFETKHDRDFWLKRKLITPRQATVVNGAGVNLTSFAPPQDSAKSNGLVVLYAGRLLRRKGLEVFLEAASLLRRDPNHSDIDMRVAGFDEVDPDAVSTETLYNNNDIQFVGSVTDMPSLLREVDVVVLPTRYNEGVPRILIEAAATGCIPIATRFPGSRMLIIEDRNRGIL